MPIHRGRALRRRDPELLVIDDLSSALDLESERSLGDRFGARRTATCLVVSHRRGVLQRADRILVLKEGRVEAEGPFARVLAESEEMRRPWEAQQQIDQGVRAGVGLDSWDVQIGGGAPVV